MAKMSNPGPKLATEAYARTFTALHVNTVSSPYGRVIFKEEKTNIIMTDEDTGTFGLHEERWSDLRSSSLKL